MPLSSLRYADLVYLSVVYVDRVYPSSLRSGSKHKVYRLFIVSTHRVCPFPRAQRMRFPEDCTKQ